MTSIAARLESPAVGRPPAERTRAALVERNIEGLLRCAAFLALAGFALAHWTSVVQNAPAGRAAALVAVCAAGGLVLWLTGELPLPAPLLLAARVLIVLGIAALGLLVTGLPARYISPHGWGALGRGLDRGLLGAQSALYPYQGNDPWVRLTILLAGPAFIVPATALAFWPAKRAGDLLRSVALALLIVLYGFALAERTPKGEIGRGFVLLLLIAAWLWLPRLRARDAAAASVLVLATAILAMPAAAKLDASKGWIDYRNWRPLSNSAGIQYDWSHTYGPITWPRRGTTLLKITADRPYYWKAEALNRFDGRVWTGGGGTPSVGPASELPPTINQAYMAHIKVSVAALRGGLLVGAGTPQQVSGAGDVELGGDGTVKSLDQSLKTGETYTVSTYYPRPTPAQMRSVPRQYEDFFRIYTRFDVPVRGVAAHIDPGLWRQRGSADAGAAELVLHSPYAPMYRLAKRLTAGAPTAYDAVHRIEAFLNSNRFAYDEHPALHKYPLESFVMRDRIGYCQQFSGAMALMLRMLGIPARVASGFAPGTPETTTPDVYTVRDLDAHSWVEVYFPGIGWATFDPTPALSPASLQSDDQPGDAAGQARKPQQLGHEKGVDPLGANAGLGLGGNGGSSSYWWLVLAAVAALAAITALGIRTRALVRERAALGTEERPLEDLRRALRRLGVGLTAGTTLTGLERILERRAGPEAGRYARLLREHRYGANGTGLPRARDRRALRRALARSTRPFGRLKALRALPPRPPSRPFRST